MLTRTHDRTDTYILKCSRPHVRASVRSCGTRVHLHVLRGAWEHLIRYIHMYTYMHTYYIHTYIEDTFGAGQMARLRIRMCCGVQGKGR